MPSGPHLASAPDDNAGSALHTCRCRPRESPASRRARGVRRSGADCGTRSSPHTMQMARSLSTVSATAMSCAIAPKGSPRKSVSVPARMTRTPRAASAVAHVDDRVVEKLRFVDRHDFGVGLEHAHETRPRCRSAPLRCMRPSWLDTCLSAGVALVEVRLEDLHAAARDLGAADAAQQLFALAAEHHAGNYLDGSGAGTVDHDAGRTR